jgi:hypothetical protein
MGLWPALHVSCCSFAAFPRWFSVTFWCSYGMFKQLIRAGEQKEVPDKWLDEGNPWEITRLHSRPPTSSPAPLTSHLTPHTSHLTPHTSHLTPHTSATGWTLCTPSDSTAAWRQSSTRTAAPPSRGLEATSWRLWHTTSQCLGATRETATTSDCGRAVPATTSTLTPSTRAITSGRCRRGTTARTLHPCCARPRPSFQLRVLV